MIPGYYWGFLTKKQNVSFADNALVLRLASESLSCGQELPGMIRNLSEIFFLENFKTKYFWMFPGY